MTEVTLFLYCVADSENCSRILYVVARTQLMTTITHSIICSPLCHLHCSLPESIPERYSFICPIGGCAAGQGTVFVLSVQSIVYNFAQVCPTWNKKARQGWKLEFRALANWASDIQIALAQFSFHSPIFPRPASFSLHKSSLITDLYSKQNGNSNKLTSSKSVEILH